MLNRLLITFMVLVVLFGRMFITPRLAVPTVEGLYESLSHIFVGFLFLVYFYDRKQVLGPTKLMAAVGCLLSFWELGWFLYQRFVAKQL